MNKPAMKRSQEPAMSKQDLNNKIADARGALTTALLSGDPTDKLRAFVRELEAQLVAMEQQEAAHIAAQRDAQAAESQRTNEAAARLLEARSARISAITARYSIPDMDKSSHV